MLFCFDSDSAELAIVLIANPTMRKTATSGIPMPKSIFGFSFIRYLLFSPNLFFIIKQNALLVGRKFFL